MRDDGCIAGAFRQLDSLHGLCQSADLIQFNKDRIPAFPVDAFLKTLRVGDKKVVSHQLHLAPQHLDVYKRQA